MSATMYTGKNGTAGVGDTNPGVDVYIEEIGEFGNGSHVVLIGEVGSLRDGDTGLPFMQKGSIHGNEEQRKLLGKARRLAKATLHGAVSVQFLGRRRDNEYGRNVVAFLVSRNAR